MSDALIELSGVTKTYHQGEVDVPVLHGIDLRIDAGDQLVIMGRSGSGKSTLMNILGCLDQPTTGSYQFAGQSVHALGDDAVSELRGQRIGFVFQSFHLLSGLTAAQNVGLPMQYQGVPPEKRLDRARDLLAKVGLADRVDHRPNQLSGGERQRVAVARALVNQPLILLADEPTGNLDSRAREQILELFAELHATTQITMVMVTHDPSIAERSPRVVEIVDGLVAADRREADA